MIKHSFKILALIGLSSSILSAQGDLVPIYGYYQDVTFSSAKNAQMAGATTATTKGYSAMLSNPAGLSTNHNATLYVKAIAGSETDSAGDSLPDLNPGDHANIGFLYDSFGIEYKLDDYIVGAGAYGLETNFGLFSAGVSYLVDQTDLTLNYDSPVQDKRQASGDYLSYGLMWQKSFIGEEDFYTLYFGMSHKNSAQYEGNKNSTLTPLSPSRTNYGFGIETNMFDTSLLLTVDLSEESWQSVSETLSGTSYGAKWMINQKFAISGGMSTKLYTGSNLKDSNVFAGGLEFGFLGLHTVTAITQRTVNEVSGGILTQTALHLDVAFTF